MRPLSTGTLFCALMSIYLEEHVLVLFLKPVSVPVRPSHETQGRNRAGKWMHMTQTQTSAFLWGGHFKANIGNEFYKFHWKAHMQEDLQDKKYISPIYKTRGLHLCSDICRRTIVVASNRARVSYESSCFSTRSCITSMRLYSNSTHRSLTLRPSVELQVPLLN